MRIGADKQFCINTLEWGYAVWFWRWQGVAQLSFNYDHPDHRVGYLAALVDLILNHRRIPTLSEYDASVYGE